MYRHMPGWNVLPRNSLNAALLETSLRQTNSMPGIMVISHEPGILNRMRGLRYNQTTWIYRDSPQYAENPNHRGDDDNIYERTDPVIYVRYLNTKAPSGAALYLGNEPQDLHKILPWTMDALNECDALGRQAVVFNLNVGRPELRDWQTFLLPLLKRLSGTHHVLGLHEYFPRDGLHIPFNVGRCKWVNEVCHQVGIQSPWIAITELGMLVGKAESLDPHKGYQKAGANDTEYAAMLELAFDHYASLPNVLGTAIYCLGQWGDGIDLQHSTGVKMRMEIWQMPTQASSPPLPIPTGEGKLVTLGQGDTYIRTAPSVGAEKVTKINVGTRMVYYPKSAHVADGLTWYVVDTIPSPATLGWMGQWHPDLNEQFVPVTEVPQPPGPPPVVPVPVPPIVPEEEEATRLNILTNLKRLEVGCDEQQALLNQQRALLEEEAALLDEQRSAMAELRASFERLWQLETPKAA